MTIVVLVEKDSKVFKPEEKATAKNSNVQKVVNKKDLLKQIEELESKFEANLKEQQTLDNKIVDLNKKLFGLMKFGKQKEKIASLKGEITETVTELNKLRHNHFEMLNDINDLGSTRFVLQEQERKAKEEEKKMRQLAIKAISKEQELIHNTYEKLERLKMDLQNGHDFLGMVNNNELNVGDLTISLNSETLSKI